jgi:hypothetical protein
MQNLALTHIKNLFIAYPKFTLTGCCILPSVPTMGLNSMYVTRFGGPISMFLAHFIAFLSLLCHPLTSQRPS